MRVVLITSFYPPSWNACAVRCYYFVKAFRERAWNVDVLVPIQPNRKESIKIGDFGERIIRLKFYTIPRSMFFDAFSTMVGTLNLIRKLSKRRCDVAVATVPPPDTSLIAHHFKAFNIVHKFVVDIRDDVASTLKEQFSYEGPLSSLQLSLAKASVPFYHEILKEADLVTTVTEGFSKYYQSTLGIKTEVVYNGSDCKLFFKASQFDKRDGNKGIIVADLEAPYHGVDIVLKAISLLLNEQLQLIIVGEGKYKKAYKKLAKELGLSDVVRFTGSIPYANIPHFLVKASFGIVGRPDALNWRLSIPTKLFEYISTGLPVFAFGPKDSEVERLINSYRIGMYVPSSDPKRIAKALKAFIYARFNRNKILNVASKFNRSSWARRMAKLIQNMVGTLKV
jgi:glycosyltransferase involved in cell wall biosynthesis